MATTKELSLQIEEVTARLRAIESVQHVMTSSPGLPLEKWSDHGFVHRHEIKPLVRAINNGGGGTAELEERIEVLESGQYVLTSSMRAVESGQAILTSSMRAVESGQAILTSVVNTKQDELTAGTGIDITDNVISATGGGSSSSIFDAFMELAANPTPYTDRVNTHAVRIGSIANKDVYAISKTVSKSLNGNTATGTSADFIGFDVTGYTLTTHTRLIPLMCFCYEKNQDNYHNIICPGFLDSDGSRSINNITTPKVPQSASYFECTISYKNTTSSSATRTFNYSLLFTLEETS